VGLVGEAANEPHRFLSFMVLLRFEDFPFVAVDPDGLALGERGIRDSYLVAVGEP
jgi:hypothetical protein